MVEPVADTDRFWKFALRIYLPEESRALFLCAQEEGGADVPMLLFCLWCGAEGAALSDTAMRAAVAFSAAWRAERVEPLRALRQGWKTAPGPGSVDLSEAARQRVATAEQAVERLQMDHLTTLRRVGEGALAADASRANLDLYRRIGGVALTDALTARIAGLVG